MDETRALLDQLLGSDRNKTEAQKKTNRKINFYGKYFIIIIF